MAKKLYQCQNENCPLGDYKNPGLFTGGRTKEAVTVVTGNPEPESNTYGQGVCPNCGTKAKEVEPQEDPREVSA